jgi:hypothetical protein
MTVSSLSLLLLLLSEDVLMVKSLMMDGAPNEIDDE